MPLWLTLTLAYLIVALLTAAWLFYDERRCHATCFHDGTDLGAILTLAALWPWYWTGRAYYMLADLRRDRARAARRNASREV